MRKNETSQPSAPGLDPGLLLDKFMAASEESPSFDACVAAFSQMRKEPAVSHESIDRAMLERMMRMRVGLNRAEAHQTQMRQLLDQLSMPPHYPAVFLALTSDPAGPCALLQCGNERRVVGIADDVDLEELQPGDEVLLSHERNCLLAKLECRTFSAGEVATFSRWTADGRLVLSMRDEEMVVIGTSELRTAGLRSGDLVRFDRAMGLAFDQVAPAQGQSYFLEGTPTDTFDDLGGQEEQIEQLKDALTMATTYRDTARKYKLPIKSSVLFDGPPGNGKTLAARATCAFMASRSLTGRSHFINIKPGALNDCYFGNTERNYRQLFRAARDAAQANPDTPVVMFFDEVDGIGSIRGGGIQRIDDKMLNAFMAELDGLESRGNIIVLAATNRLDALDPALLRPGRLGELVLHFPAPNRRGARSILSKHLPKTIPYAVRCMGADEAREVLLDGAVASLFAETPETEVANLMMRDGKRRLVRASELVSGAQLAALARSSIERACLREVRGGAEGVTEADMHAAIAGFLRSAARPITPLSARNYLADLPADVDVVRVDKIERRVSNPRRYVLEAA